MMHKCPKPNMTTHNNSNPRGDILEIHDPDFSAIYW